MATAKKTKPEALVVASVTPTVFFRLNTPVKDSVTGTKGRLVGQYINLGGNEYYTLQPTGLNTETGMPLEVEYISPARVVGGVRDYAAEKNIPVQVLGQQATDEASGFSGMITSLIRHVNGCVHAHVQASTRIKGGKLVDPVDFDLRRLVGPNIPKFTEEEIQQDIKKRPSPTGAAYGMRPGC